MTSKQSFTREYIKAVRDGYAAVFAGAGLSRASGYVNWKELIDPLAKDIDLDVNKEHDLVAVAQYYKNEHGGAAGINQTILNEFTKDVRSNENIQILTRLPIYTYWTTNYDSLLEDGLKSNNRKADVKINQDQLATNIYDRDAVVYKMHGDAQFPQDAILTKDDYESYEVKKPLFRTALQGDLISKTFLFIGFSFNDPNLDYVLSQIRLLLGESQREHYCFFEKISKNDGESEEDYCYRKCQQDLRIKDLKRYGIQAVLLDSYNEITEILKAIEDGIKSKNIFISGSISHFTSPWTKDNVNLFSYTLANELVKSGYKVISGFGLGIGSSVINGALDEIYKSKFKHLDEHLCLRPFPQYTSHGVSLKSRWTQYRNEIISESGIAIFMFGNKTVCSEKDATEEVVIANGMLEEFEIAKSKKLVIIPLGSTGGAAKRIFDEIESNIIHYQYLQKHLNVLKNETDPNILLEVILQIIKEHQPH